LSINESPDFSKMSGSSMANNLKFCYWTKVGS